MADGVGMKITRHHIAAAVTVLALGVLAAAALASGRPEAPQQSQPTAQAAAATPEVRTEVVRETVHRRREDRREDRAARTTTAAPAATPAAARTSGRDASGHGGRGRDHAEDDGTVEIEHHENEVEDHGGHGGRGEVEDHGGHGGGGHGDDD